MDRATLRAVGLDIDNIVFVAEGAEVFIKRSKIGQQRAGA